MTVGNAASGHRYRYGYRKSVTLAGLKEAPVVFLSAPAESDGALTLEIPREPGETGCFYQIVAE